MTPPEITIRRASRADVDLVLSADDLLAHPPTAEWTQDFLDRGSNLLILALRDDRPVGILVGVETGHLGASPDLFIYGIVVREDLRGHGIAHRLVEKAVEVAEEAGCTRVWGSVHRHDEPDADVRGAGSPFAGVTASGGDDDELTTRSTSTRSTTFVIPIP
ncbi:GNAT family N-acetyltransferase [Dietzia aerolata]|uniref:GNAT family N-acetyltransferase n=1 Tax=Dietzia aerolata TaxID=595984 RepID=A0ABV5JUR6_9ACTN|nr:GNAT family N-acetyltransferase [Dietzia aerolata]MBB0970135.1 GNAT family N-acetyltransferase [Dietzia aerolata]